MVLAKKRLLGAGGRGSPSSTAGSCTGVSKGASRRSMPRATRNSAAPAAHSPAPPPWRRLACQYSMPRTIMPMPKKKPRSARPSGQRRARGARDRVGQVSGGRSRRARSARRRRLRRPPQRRSWAVMLVLPAGKTARGGAGRSPSAVSTACTVPSPPLMARTEGFRARSASKALGRSAADRVTSWCTAVRPPKLSMSAAFRALRPLPALLRIAMRFNWLASRP